MTPMKPGRCPYHLSGCEVAIEKDGDGYFRVVADCGASSPWSKTKKLAIYQWNVIREEPLPERTGIL